MRCKWKVSQFLSRKENEEYIYIYLEAYIFLRFEFDSIGGNRGDGLIENKTEEGTRGSLTSRASLTTYASWLLPLRKTVTRLASRLN